MTLKERSVQLPRDRTQLVFTAGDGSPLVWLHGINGPQADAPIIEALASLGHSVYAPLAPGFNNLDFRISRDVPIHENIRLQFIGEAFNLLNRRIITGVVGTYSVYNAAVAPTTSAPNPACNVNTQTPGPAGSPLQGCIAPFTGTGANAFGAPSSTSNSLFGPRQLQVSAKLFF